MRTIPQNQVLECSFRSAKARRDPFNEIEVSVRLERPDGTEVLVPAFWAGGRQWRARLSSPLTGRHRFQTICSDPADGGLQGREGAFQVVRYAGANALYRHGGIRVAADRRHLEHVDGTPFFWLGDTWWLGLCQRLDWLRGFRQLTADRVQKGFSVIQIAAGLYPDMPAFDPRGQNEAGFPWEKKYTRINPAYFDRADRRIEHLVQAGLMPCLVGAWGFHLSWLGVRRMKQHWRNLVARYGAYPIVWCLAGEAAMPWYLSKNREADRDAQRHGWTEVGTYARRIDGFHRPITIHPTHKGREQVEDPAVLDFEMLQTGHGDMRDAARTVQSVREQRRRAPRMPVLVGEVCYEGIGDACGPRVQRHMFWTAMLSGAAGHTYGANGIWQMNTRAKPYGPSPHGMAWGGIPWQEACQLPGSRQLGLARRLLERYEWWRLEPHPEWVDNARNLTKGCLEDYPAGIRGKLRIIYSPNCIFMEQKNLEPEKRWQAYLFNPRDGTEHHLGQIKLDRHHNWKREGYAPVYHDWVIVLEVKGGRRSAKIGARG